MGHSVCGLSKRNHKEKAYVTRLDKGRSSDVNTKVSKPTDRLHKKSISVDLFYACETLRRELTKSVKIAKKFNKELKLTNHEKEKLVVRLDESNKKNEFLRNQLSSKDKKMKSLEQELVESKAKLENLTSTKPAVVDRCVSISLKPKAGKICIPSFKRNHKEKAYVARLDKGKSFDVDIKVSKPKSKPTNRLHKKSVFVPTRHLCGVVGHIRPNCSLLRQKPKSKTKSAIRNTDVPKFVHVCHFCGVSGHICPSCHKLKFKHVVFQSRTCDDISSAISLDKLLHMLLKNLSLLACERKLQNFSLSQKKFVISQMHSTSHGFSPTKPKTRSIWVRKDLLR